jgi:hypothetical protein
MRYVGTKEWANSRTGTTRQLCICFMIVLQANQTNTSFLFFYYYCTVHFDNVQNSFHQQMHPLLNI